MPSLAQNGKTSLVAVALRDEIEASQHDKHGAGDAQPEASHENLPNNESLTRRKADHDAQTVDDVENDGADGKEQRQELNTGRYGHANSHDKAEDAEHDQSDGYVIGKTLLNVFRNRSLIDVLQRAQEIGQTLAPNRLLFSVSASSGSGIYFVCFRFRHKPTSLLAGTPSNIIKPRSYP